jgi:hypothetical protein
VINRYDYLFYCQGNRFAAFTIDPYVF